MYDIANRLHFLAFALSVLESNSMAGGYRIFIECLRHWLNQGHTAELITSRQGQVMVHRYLKSPNLQVRVMGPAGPSHNPGFRSLWYSGSLYVLRALNGIYKATRGPGLASGTVVYSTTPFWPDVLPALALRRRNPHALWLTAFSMFAPPVLGGWLSGVKAQTKLIEKRALALKTNEILAYPIIRRWSDVIYVNNDLDLERIRSDGVSRDRTLVIGGGVDVELYDSVPSVGATEYDAVFVGRFHPQKGVLELVDIWRGVCQTLPQARLIMVGNGVLEDAVAQKIQRMGMEKNILLAGFKDGEEKIRIFRRSRIVLHPAVYDSGGMAAAEAMACGLPGVSFDLPALRVYYPKGMLKAQNQDGFVKNVIDLLTDSGFYDKVSDEAESWARTWDWRIVSQRLLKKCQAVIGCTRTA